MLTKSSSLKTTFSGVDFSKYSSKTSEFVSEFSSRANQPGKFLNWVNLPQEQLKRLDVDFVAYQDEVGVKKTTEDKMPEPQSCPRYHHRITSL